MRALYYLISILIAASFFFTNYLFMKYLFYANLVVFVGVETIHIFNKKKRERN